MFEALIITLREGVEAALVVGIILTYLKTTGRGHLRPWVFSGIAAALVASLAGAAILPRLPINQEAYEGALMLAAGVLVATLVVWMTRHARSLKEQIESKVGTITARSGAAAGAGLFLLTFLLIFREGAETVLFLAAVRLSTEGLWTLAGAAAGLILAIGFGIAFVRGAVRIDLARFFRVTAIVLLVFAANLLAGGFHELAEAGAIPIGPRTMAILGPIVKSQSLLLAALLAIPLLVILVPGRAEREERGRLEGLEGPERRLGLSRARRQRAWRIAAAVGGLVIIGSLTVSVATSRFPTAVDPPHMVEPNADGEVRITVAGNDDGHLHRFGVDLDRVTVRFLVMGSADDLRVAFDACELCGAFGYLEDGPHVVCLACAADINSRTIGSPGGCNPIPLPHVRDGGTLVIRVTDLRAQVPAFAQAASSAASPPGA